MSEFTSAQIDALVKRADDALRQYDEIRSKLEAVMKRIEETGYAAHDAWDRKNAATRTTAK
jgi:flagellin-like hook-associated protein FlgL